MLAGDWPQLLGPMRNGISPETNLAVSGPKEGPPVVWQKKVGEGFSGPVVAEGKLILFHRPGNVEAVECLDARTGKARWKAVAKLCDLPPLHGELQDVVSVG